LRNVKEISYLRLFKFHHFVKDGMEYEEDRGGGYGLFILKFCNDTDLAFENICFKLGET